MLLAESSALRLARYLLEDYFLVLLNLLVKTRLCLSKIDWSRSLTLLVIEQLTLALVVGGYPLSAEIIYGPSSCRRYATYDSGCALYSTCEIGTCVYLGNIQ